MAENIISDCVNLAANLSSSIDVTKYLPFLTGIVEENYDVSRIFAGVCSNSMLAIMFKLGHFGGDVELLNIAADIITVRSLFEHEEEDVGGHVADLMREYRTIGSGKCFNCKRFVYIIKVNSIKLTIKYL